MVKGLGIYVGVEVPGLNPGEKNSDVFVHAFICIYIRVSQLRQFHIFGFALYLLS